MGFLTVSDAAREISNETGVTVRPKQISTLFYCGHLRNDVAPVVGGRRLIPRDYVPMITMALRRAGKLSL